MTLVFADIRSPDANTKLGTSFSTNGLLSDDENEEETCKKLRTVSTHSTFNAQPFVSVVDTSAKPSNLSDAKTANVPAYDGTSGGFKSNGLLDDTLPLEMQDILTSSREEVAMVEESAIPADEYAHREETTIGVCSADNLLDESQGPF